MKIIPRQAIQNKADILVEPDGIIFAVENRLLTSEEKKLLQQHIGKKKLHS